MIQNVPRELFDHHIAPVHTRRTQRRALACCCRDLCSLLALPVVKHGPAQALTEAIQSDHWPRAQALLRWLPYKRVIRLAARAGALDVLRGLWPGMSVAKKNLMYFSACARGRWDVLLAFPPREKDNANLAQFPYMLHGRDALHAEWRDNYKNCAFMSSLVWHNRLDVLQWLAQMYFPEIREVMRYECLLAVKLGRVEIVQWILAEPATFQEWGSVDHDPLFARAARREGIRVHLWAEHKDFRVHWFTEEAWLAGHTELAQWLEEKTGVGPRVVYILERLTDMTAERWAKLAPLHLRFAMALSEPARHWRFHPYHMAGQVGNYHGHHGTPALRQHVASLLQGRVLATYRAAARESTRDQ